MYSLHILIALLDYKKTDGDVEDADRHRLLLGENVLNNSFNSTPEYTWPARPKSHNTFLILLAQLHSKNDLDIISSGFLQLLSHPLQAISTYLPGSVKNIIYYEELLMLLWIIIGNNKVGVI
jgi:hypothetical protein